MADQVDEEVVLVPVIPPGIVPPPRLARVTHSLSGIALAATSDDDEDRSDEEGGYVPFDMDKVDDDDVYDEDVEYVRPFVPSSSASVVSKISTSTVTLTATWASKAKGNARVNAKATGNAKVAANGKAAANESGGLLTGPGT